MSNTSRESVWLMNPHGVKVALPPHLAAERLKQAGYQRCEPDFVPAIKQYPIDGELTEEGEKRRLHRHERAMNPIIPARLREVATTGLSDEYTPQSAATPVAKLLSPAEYRQLNWQELRQYAALRGINALAGGMTKEKVLAALDASANVLPL